MTYKDFVKAVANESGATQVVIKQVLDAIAPVFADVIRDCDEVTVGGVKVMGYKTEAKDGVSALTGKPWHSDAHYAVKVKAMPSLKKAVRE